ncbi:MAG: hypothetical protein LV479_08920 [Methylacidiphilales bacterium]|nr:hypothetical protein [Candidatus Methylacidiphilales bacterium]
MNNVRLGLIDIGGVGAGYSQGILSGKVSGTYLTAFARKYPDQKPFTSGEALNSAAYEAWLKKNGPSRLISIRIPSPPKNTSV